MIKHLNLLKIGNKMDISANLLQWLINVLMKTFLIQTKELKLITNRKNCRKNYRKQLLKNLKNEKYSHVF